MSVLSSNDRQLTLIYNSRSSLGKQTLGYVQSSGEKVQTIDISKTKLGDTVWVSIAEALEKPLGDLFAKELPEVPNVDTSDFETGDWLKLLNNNPALLQHPIAINGKKYMQVKTPSEVLKFFQVDSAGLEKTKAGQSPTTRNQAEGDKFV